MLAAILASKNFLGKILVAIEDSNNDEPVVTFAIELAMRTGSRIEFCNVFNRADGITSKRGLAYAPKQTMEHVMIRAEAAGLCATSSMLEGVPADAIGARGVQGAFDAMVVGNSHESHLERAFRGCVADDILRGSVIPVFVVPITPGRANDGARKLLVAVDDSDPSDGAISFAIGFALATRAQLMFCTVSDAAAILDNAQYFGTDLGATLAELHAAANELLNGASARAAARNVASESIVISGPPAKSLLSEGSARHADMLVIGTHGRRGLRRFVLGSVAEAVVQRSNIPVAVIRGGK